MVKIERKCHLSFLFLDRVIVVLFEISLTLGSTAAVRCFPVSGHTDKACFKRRPAVHRMRCIVCSRLPTLNRARATEKI